MSCPIANNCTSTFRLVEVAALVTSHRLRTSSATTKCRLLLGKLKRITLGDMRTQRNTRDANN